MPLVLNIKNSLQSEEQPLIILNFCLLSLQLGIARAFQLSTVDQRPEAELKAAKLLIFNLELNPLD